MILKENKNFRKMFIVTEYAALKEAAQADLVYLYQNATLLEIICQGSKFCISHMGQQTIFRYLHVLNMDKSLL